MRGVLTSTGMKAINTFRNVHQGPSATFANNRIGYIILDEQMAPCITAHGSTKPSTCCIARRTTNPCLPTCVLPLMPNQKDNNPWFRQDRSPQAGVEIKNQRDFHLLQKDPGWEISIDEHAEKLTRHIQEGLSKAFPIKHQHPQQPFVGTNTWQLIIERNNIRKSINDCKKASAISFLGKCWGAWNKEKEPQRQEDGKQIHFLRCYKAILEEMKEKTDQQIRKKCRATEGSMLNKWKKSWKQHADLATPGSSLISSGVSGQPIHAKGSRQPNLCHTWLAQMVQSRHWMNGVMRGRRTGAHWRLLKS